jgi:hypothetical protein
MFRHVQNWLQQNWLQVIPPLVKRSTVPARKRIAQARVECLESRCLLAFAFLENDFVLSLQTGSSAVFSGNNFSRNQGELELQQMELVPNKITPDRDEGGLIPVPNIPWQPDPSPILSGNGSANLTPAVPDAVPDVVPEDPGKSGGFTELPDETELENSVDPASPYDDPSPREVNAVMQMLAALQYPLGGSETSPAADDLLGDVDQSLRSRDSESLPADGGSIAIAVSEIADELESARPLSHELEQSLLEISVQMDRSAGRFQAFEVLTLEQPALPSTEQPLREVQRTSQPAAVNVEESPNEAAELSTPLSQSSAHGSDASSTAAVGDSAQPLATETEKSGSTWSLAIAVVTFGFVLQLLHDRHGERLKARASAIWQSLIAVTFWKSARQPTRPAK